MARFLLEQGYAARALRGGFAAWKRAGLPTEPKAVEVSTTVADVCPECGAPATQHA